MCWSGLRFRGFRWRWPPNRLGSGKYGAEAPREDVIASILHRQAATGAAALPLLRRDG
jgi:hypothetical protein